MKRHLLTLSFLAINSVNAKLDVAFYKNHILYNESTRTTIANKLDQALHIFFDEAGKKISLEKADDYVAAAKVFSSGILKNVHDAIENAKRIESNLSTEQISLAIENNVKRSMEHSQSTEQMVYDFIVMAKDLEMNFFKIKKSDSERLDEYMSKRVVDINATLTTNTVQAILDMLEINVNNIDEINNSVDEVNLRKVSEVFAGFLAQSIEQDEAHIFVLNTIDKVYAFAEKWLLNESSHIARHINNILDSLDPEFDYSEKSFVEKFFTVASVYIHVVKINANTPA